MTVREKLYEKRPSLPSLPSLGTIADGIEYLSFGVLALAVLSFAGMGVAIAINGLAFAAVAPFLNAAGGLLLTFVSLFLLAIIVDGGNRYIQYIQNMGQNQQNQTAEQQRRR